METKPCKLKLLTVSSLLWALLNSDVSFWGRMHFTLLSEVLLCTVFT